MSLWIDRPIKHFCFQFSIVQHGTITRPYLNSIFISKWSLKPWGLEKHNFVFLAIRGDNSTLVDFWNIKHNNTKCDWSKVWPRAGVKNAIWSLACASFFTAGCSWTFVKVGLNFLPFQETQKSLGLSIYFSFLKMFYKSIFTWKWRFVFQSVSQLFQPVNDL